MFKFSSKLKKRSLSSLIRFNRRAFSSAAQTNKVPVVMCVNRGEIATRVYRAAHELGFNSLGVYSDVDTNSLHRFKVSFSFWFSSNHFLGSKICSSEYK